MALMDVFNMFGEQDWDRENDRPGYRHRTTVIGERLGATLLGGSLYELPPGEKTWPYHYELGCEELVNRGLGPAHPPRAGWRARTCAG
jgi:uncharacterized cupin superfamily protein